MHLKDLQTGLFPVKEMYMMSCGENGKLPLITSKSRHYASKAVYENLHLMDDIPVTGEYGLPVVNAYNGPLFLEAIAYSKRNKYSGKGQFVHFFADDYTWAFPLWHRTEATIHQLIKFDGMFGPDFSLYVDRPKGFNIMQLFKNRLITSYAQRIGYNVIPTASFGDVDSLDYCFDGLPENSVLGICGTGLKTHSHRVHWEYGVCALLEIKKPTTLVVYGEPIVMPYVQIPMIFITDEQSKYHNNGKMQLI